MSNSTDSPGGNAPIQNNGLWINGFPEGLENIQTYNPGGNHPVLLGDHLGPIGRYRVIHKLGSGGFANVWLCRDRNSSFPKYIALKVLMARASTRDCRELRVNKLKEMSIDQKAGGKHICVPLDSFWIDGPNGSHLCLVYPVLGPPVDSISKEFEDPAKALRKIASQAVLAMDLLHNHGICHGDFTPSNILLQTSGFDGLTEEQLIQVLGEPVRLGVETSSGEPASVPIAPKYVVRPIKFEKIDPRFISDQICVIDYGESFEVSNPPKYIGTPQIYRSPELVLDDTVGIGCDLWALGCTLFATRTGRPLFNLFDNDVDENLSRMVLLFGKLPKPWWTGWEGRRANFEDEEEDSLGRVRLISRTPEDADARAMELDRHNQPRSIREALAQILSYQKYETQYPIPQRDEIELLADLLGKLLKYNPQERITAEMAKDHMWFKM